MLQRIYKLPLQSIPEKDFTGAFIAEILDRVIIGPTPVPRPMIEAFVNLLTRSGVNDARQRVVVSDILLRR